MSLLSDESTTISPSDAIAQKDTQGETQAVTSEHLAGTGMIIPRELASVLNGCQLNISQRLM